MLHLGSQGELDIARVGMTPNQSPLLAEFCLFDCLSERLLLADQRLRRRNCSGISNGRYRLKSGQSASIKSGSVCKIRYQLLLFMRWMWIVKLKTPYQFLFFNPLFFLCVLCAFARERIL